MLPQKTKYQPGESVELDVKARGPLNKFMPILFQLLNQSDDPGLSLACVLP